MNKIISSIILAIVVISILSTSESVFANQLFNESDQSPDMDYTYSSLIDDVESDMVVSYVENLTNFGARVTTSQQGIESGRYIYQELQDMGLTVRYHNWSISPSLYGSNIEATLHGVDPQCNDTIIVCAHYDSVYGSPGADDNAAGTAAVLASAKVLSKYFFSYTIKFVAFSGEEQGLLGSNAYSREAYEKNESITAVLNADMIGYAPNIASERKVHVFDNKDSAWIKDLAQNITIQYKDLINLTIVSGEPGGMSDHAPFQARGYDAVFFHEYTFNPHYHSTHDILEYLNPLYMRNVTRLITGCLVDLADPYTPIHPAIPDTPSGPNQVSSDTEYTYTTSSTDENNEMLYYLWDWGDNQPSEWIGPFESGEQCIVQKSWDEPGLYQIHVKVKDTFGLESNWSDPLQITVSKHKSKLFNINDFFEEKHFSSSFISLIEQIIQYITHIFS